MKTKKLFLLATITALCFASPAMAQGPVKVHTEGLAAKIPWTGPVPKANCGRWDWTESGLQGQTTPWERESGDSEGGYNCNLELVGQFQGEGARSQGGRRTSITAPTISRITILCSSAPVSWWWMPRTPGIHGRPRIWTTLCF
jgi:hypothetical protein